MSFKLIKLVLEHTSTSIELYKLVFNDVIRVSDERVLLAGTLEDSLVYRKTRNITSHTYSQEAAYFIIATAKHLYYEERFILTNLKHDENNLACNKILTLVNHILREHFGEDGPDVYVLMSRATCKNIKKYSDIDLSIMLDGNKYVASAALLESKSSDSYILSRVNVANYNSVSDEFLAIIDRDKIKLYY